MRYLLTLIFCIFLLQVSSAEQTGIVEFEQKSQNALYQGTLQCQSDLSIGTFQECWLKLLHNDKPVENVEILISGGMPAHKHGLPTMPKVTWLAEKSNYQIKGLKFSMPGQWSLNFKINTKDEALQDEIIIRFEID